MAPSSSPAAIDSLPYEILAYIFDHLEDLRTTLSVSHVSTSWRIIVHCHPSFGSYVRFVYSDEEGRNWDARCSLFAQQVTCSSLPLHLTIRYYGHERLVLNTLLSVLSQTMDRVVSLELSLHARQPSVMYKILDTPAPLLEWLRIGRAGRPFGFDKRPHVASTIFSTANRLKPLILSYVDLPNDLSGLKSVEHLVLYNHGGAAQIAPAVALCKQLRRLNLLVNHNPFLPDADLEAAMRIPSVASLDYIHLHMPKRIHTSYAFMMPHLVGQLRLELTAMPRTPTRAPTTAIETQTLFSIKISDEATGRERLFRGHNTADLADISHEFHRHGLASRVVELSMRMNMLRIAARLLPSLPCLEVFTLQLTSVPSSDISYPPQPRLYAPPIAVDDECHDMSPIACPSLRTVVIKGQGRDCRTSWLAGFMGSALGASCRQQLELEMRGAILVGDTRSIGGYFKSIFMYPD